MVGSPSGPRVQAVLVQGVFGGSLSPEFDGRSEATEYRIDVRQRWTKPRYRRPVTGWRMRGNVFTLSGPAPLLGEYVEDNSVRDYAARIRVTTREWRRFAWKVTVVLNHYPGLPPTSAPTVWHKASREANVGMVQFAACGWLGSRQS